MKQYDGTGCFTAKGMGDTVLLPGRFPLLNPSATTPPSLAGFATTLSPDWIRVTIRYDAATAASDVFLNGTLAAAGIPAATDALPGTETTWLRVRGHTFHPTYFDDVQVTTLNPCFNDADRDGMSDEYEVAHGQSPVVDDRSADPDNDGLTNITESIYGSDPLKADTDSDGMGDPWEIQYKLNPLRAKDAHYDLDGDGATNLEEYTASTDPWSNPDANSASPSMVYVRADAAGQMDGSQVFPFDNIQTALTVVADGGTLVLDGSGGPFTGYGNRGIYLDKFLRFHGVNHAIIDCENQESGFFLYAYSYTYGFPPQEYGSSPCLPALAGHTFRDLTFRNSAGSAIACHTGTPLNIIRCSFEGTANSPAVVILDSMAGFLLTQWYTQGFYYGTEWSATAWFEDCLFRNNTAGAISVDSGLSYTNATGALNFSFRPSLWLEVVQTRFENNSGAPATRVTAVGSQFINCLWKDNTSNGTGGALLLGSPALPTLTHCTFLGNDTGPVGAVQILPWDLADPYYSGFPWSGPISPLAIRSSILWGNTPSDVFDPTFSADAAYSTIQNSFPGVVNYVSTLDPLFLPGTAWPSAASPAIDAADPGSPFSTDIVHQTRRDKSGTGTPGTTADQGAYEFSPDSDADGLADLLEEQHGLDPANSTDGAADFDQDGFANSTEIAAGSNHNDAASIPASAAGTIVLVDPLNGNESGNGFPSPVKTISRALTLATATTPAKTIILRDGTYTGTANRDWNFAGKAVTLRSVNGPTRTIIDLAGAGRAARIPASHPGGLSITGLAFRNGSGEGAAFFIAGHSTDSFHHVVTFTDCWFIGGSAIYSAVQENLIFPGHAPYNPPPGGFPSNGPAYGWEYCQPGTDLGSSAIVQGHPSWSTANWKHPDYVETNQVTFQYNGRGQFGAGDGDETSYLNIGPAGARYPAFYFRTTFGIGTLRDPSIFSDLQLRAIIDDGAIFYLNGQEIARDNMPSGAVGYAYSNSNAIDETAFRNITDSRITASRILPGPNVFCVEVHQINADSSDLSFDLELLASVGDAGHGGALRIQGPRGVVAHRCQFLANSAERSGGAVYADTGSRFTASACTFRYNEADAAGGAIYGQSATVLLQDGTDLSFNLAGASGTGTGTPLASFEKDGGALYLLDPAPASQLSACTLTGNAALDDGGGLYVKVTSSIPPARTVPLLTGTRIEANAATHYLHLTTPENALSTNRNGGGLYLDSLSSTFTVQATVITRNECEGDGGGVRCTNSSLTLVANAIIENRAANAGGGLHFSGATEHTTQLRQCTIVGNVANNAGGGGIRRDSGGLVMDGLILWWNQSSLGPQATSPDYSPSAEYLTIAITNSNAQGRPGAVAPTFAGDRYHLMSFSPDRDTGGTAGYTDIDGETAFGIRDRGCDEFVDTDNDKLPDHLELLLINYSPSDSIQSLADVKPEDDFDTDGFANSLDMAYGNATQATNLQLPPRNPILPMQITPEPINDPSDVVNTLVLAPYLDDGSTSNLDQWWVHSLVINGQGTPFDTVMLAPGLQNNDPVTRQISTLQPPPSWELYMTWVDGEGDYDYTYDITIRQQPPLGPAYFVYNPTYPSDELESLVGDYDTDPPEDPDQSLIALTRRRSFVLTGIFENPDLEMDPNATPDGIKHSRLFVLLNGDNDNPDEDHAYDVSAQDIEHLSAIPYSFDAQTINNYAKNFGGVPTKRDYDSETPLAAADEELVELKINVPRQGSATKGPGSAWWSIAATGDKVKLWLDNKKTQKITGKLWLQGYQTSPLSIWIEGIKLSENLTDTAEITLEGPNLPTHKVKVVVGPVIQDEPIYTYHKGNSTTTNEPLELIKEGIPQANILQAVPFSTTTLSITVKSEFKATAYLGGKGKLGFIQNVMEFHSKCHLERSILGFANFQPWGSLEVNIPNAPITDADDPNIVVNAFYRNPTSVVAGSFAPTDCGMDDSPKLFFPDTFKIKDTDPNDPASITWYEVRLVRQNNKPVNTTVLRFKTYVVFLYPDNRSILPLGHFGWRYTPEGYGPGVTEYGAAELDPAVPWQESQNPPPCIHRPGANSQFKDTYHPQPQP